MESTAIIPHKDLLTAYKEKFKNIRFSENNDIAYDSIYYFLENDGKQIRPLLLLSACNMFGSSPELAHNPAYGVQMFHNFTLVHDDIIDEADIRRGQPSVHKKYGEANAIISGDIMLIIAYEYISRIDEDILPLVLKNFNKTAREIIEGQQMDIEFETRMDVTEKEYLTMTKYKTSVLLAECLRIGAIIARTSQQDIENIYNFGLNLGLSFQIKDDWLDSFGAGDKFGKKIGGDILQNKKTMLFVNAMEKANDATKEKISSLMTCEDDDKKISDMLNVYRELGLDKKIQYQMREFYDTSLDYLDKIDVEESRKEPLRNFAETIYHRDH